MVLQVICKLSFSECRQHVVKEAFKINILEVNESKTDDMGNLKFVKVVCA